VPQHVTQPTATAQFVSRCQAELISQTEYFNNAHTTSIIHYPVTRSGGKVTAGAPFNSTANLPEGFYYSHSSIDPNGSCREVFVKGSDNPELWIHDLSGSNPHQVMFHDKPIQGNMPDWGYLFNQIVYVNFDGQLMKTSPTGLVNTPLGVVGTDPDISPNGRWVAYQDANGKLSIVSINGKKVANYSTSLECNMPRWSPKGEGVLCNTANSGLVFYTSMEKSTVLYKNGLDAVMDARILTKAAVITELISSGVNSQLVQNVFDIANLSSLQNGSQKLDSGENPDWWAWNEPHVFTDSFMFSLTQSLTK
jgi:hypothetical protein